MKACAIMLYKLRIISDYDMRKICKKYERFIEELKLYSRAIRVLFKRLSTPFQIRENFE